MIRVLLLLLLVAAVALLAGIFAWLNPGLTSLNLGPVGEFELKKSLAFALTLVTGWMLGVLSALVLVLKLLRDRRKLRRNVRLAEAEADNLRSLPLRDGG